VNNILEGDISDLKDILDASGMIIYGILLCIHMSTDAYSCINVYLYMDADIYICM
jgi:hypothetical protein